MSFNNEIFNCFSPEIEEIVRSVYSEKMEEVRMRLGLPLSIFLSGESFFLGKYGIVSDLENAYMVTKDDIDYALSHITKGSYYSYEDEIKNGFVTIYGGHRVGIGGRGVMESVKVSAISDISSFNFRFARQIKNCADGVVSFIKNGREVSNTIIVSPPGCGKTTMLREIARKLSYMDMKICIIDERHELCSLYEGQPFYDIGPNTDVYCGIAKKEAVPMAVRCLSPQVIITDELGKTEDFESVLYASSCGVSTVASIHGSDISDLLKKTEYKKIIESFEKFIILGYDKRVKRKGKLKEELC